MHEFDRSDDRYDEGYDEGYEKGRETGREEGLYEGYDFGVEAMRKKALALLNNCDTEITLARPTR